MNLNPNLIVGVDIGGSHITVAIVDLKTFEILPGSFFRNPINQGDNADNIIASWANTIKSAIQSKGLSGVNVGIAIPGPFDYDKGISYMSGQGKYDSLYGKNVKILLSEELGISPNNIKLNNDAACFLQGEIFCGELIKYQEAIGLTLGTGLGSSYMIEKKAFDADLWGTPFKDGIIEDYISTRWFVKEFKKRTGITVTDLKDMIEKDGDHDAIRTIFDDFISHLVSFIYEFIKTKNPEVIVIGGNITKAQDFFIEQTRKELRQVTGFDIPIHVSLLGENAALIGAASLFIDPFYFSK